MVGITDNKVPWRDELLPAAFRGALFHTESGAREGGRRIVTHQFFNKNPNRETPPYSEDMGRRAAVFTVRGYIATFPVDTPVALYSRDYRRARDALIEALDSSAGPGVLQLPTIAPMTVVCPQYRWLEEEKAGGYVVFDMQFVEYGAAPGEPQVSSVENLKAASLVMKAYVQRVLANLDQPVFLP